MPIQKPRVRRFVALAASSLIVSGCALIPTSSGATNAQGDTDGLEIQSVNNAAVFDRIDERLAQLSDDPGAQLRYLGLQGCAAQIGMAGVFGGVDDNPLMRRWNAINERYNRIYGAQPGTDAPGSLTGMMDLDCPNEFPKG